jgi:hypothetical protein
MGTLKEEMVKVKAVLNEWDAQDAQATQPQEKVMEKKRTSVSKVMEFIIANPGINSIDIRKRVLAKYPEIQESHISSTLKQLTDSYQVTRVEVHADIGRNTYNYTVVPEGERQAILAAEKAKHRAAVARAEKARAAKAAKAAEREALGVQLGISDLVPKFVPQENVGEMGEAIKTWQHTNLIWTADKVINELSVLQARELYDRLKQIFGG